jgi:hypothetical protein|tara:strand:- start:5485 stop:5595 length:111 start_codon:yes stop_codon:yes gene_type:complete
MEEEIIVDDYFDDMVDDSELDRLKSISDELKKELEE